MAAHQDSGTLIGFDYSHVEDHPNRTESSEKEKVSTVHQSLKLLKRTSEPVSEISNVTWTDVDIVLGESEGVVVLQNSLMPIPMHRTADEGAPCEHETGLGSLDVEVCLPKGDSITGTVLMALGENELTENGAQLAIDLEEFEFFRQPEVKPKQKLASLLITRPKTNLGT